MPSEIAQTIVNHIFSDEKAKAIDASKDAFTAAAYDAVEAKKVEFAKEWGFNPDETGQKDADKIADKTFDGQEAPELSPTAGEVAQQETDEPKFKDIQDLSPDEQPDVPASWKAEPTEEQPVEEPKNETDS